MSWELATKMAFDFARPIAMIALASLLAGCGMEANDDGRRTRGEMALVDDAPFAVRPEGDQYCCSAMLPATAERPAGPCLKPLGPDMTCPSCKIQYRKRDEQTETLNDVNAIADAVKAEAEAPMKKAIDELREEMRKQLEESHVDASKLDQLLDADKLVQAVKDDKDASGKNAIDRIAEAERLKWDSEKRRLTADGSGKRDIAFLKPGSKPLAYPLLICPNPDCKQPVDPASNRCRECKQFYVVDPSDLAVALQNPLESTCPYCKKPVDPTTNLCRGCDKLYRAQIPEGVCWRCGGARFCPECGGSGNSIEAPGTGLSVCWACMPASGASGDQTTVRGDGLCAECRGRGFIDYEPALPPQWNMQPTGRGKWKITTGEAAATKAGEGSKPEKEEKRGE